MLSTKWSMVLIREANKKDCIKLAVLSLGVWLQTYAIDGISSEVSEYALSTFTEDYFNELLQDDKYKLLVNVEDDFLRGYVLINFESNFQSENYGFEIEKLYVQGAFQGQSIGSNLLSEIETLYGNKFWLYTWVRNKSLGFYKKFGFVDVGQYDFNFGSSVIENRVLRYG